MLASEDFSLGNTTKIAATKSYSQKTRFAKFIRLLHVKKHSPHHRVQDCFQRVVPGRKTVDLYYSPKAKETHYKNIMRCGSVWVCPVCSAKITECRRVELTDAVAAARGLGLVVVMVTYTLQHNKGDRLRLLLDALKNARRAMRSGRPWQALSDAYGVVGSVRSVEVTYGPLNGWHPHIHELLFLRPGASGFDLAKFTEDMRELWVGALARQGRTAEWVHGLDVKTADSDVAAYVAKFGKEPEQVWTLAHEMTKGPVKLASLPDRFSMWQIVDLMAMHDHEVESEGLPANQYSWAEDVWAEFVRSIKGTHHIDWSKGLRASLGLAAELTDEQLAEQEPDDSAIFASFTLDDWKKIVAGDWQPLVMEVGRVAAETGNLKPFTNLLSEIGITDPILYLSIISPQHLTP